MSGKMVWLQPFNELTPSILKRLDPIPEILAPILTNILHNCWIYGSHAALYISVNPLANVAAIAAQKFKAPSKQTPSTSGGGVGGDLTSPTQAPSFNVVGQSQANQVSMALANQPPTQAFVVAGDVTTAQELQNNTIQQATF